MSGDGDDTSGGRDGCGGDGGDGSDGDDADDNSDDGDIGSGNDGDDDENYYLEQMGVDVATDPFITITNSTFSSLPYHTIQPYDNVR